MIGALQEALSLSDPGTVAEDTRFGGEREMSHEMEEELAHKADVTGKWRLVDGQQLCRGLCHLLLQIVHTKETYHQCCEKVGLG